MSSETFPTITLPLLRSISRYATGRRTTMGATSNCINCTTPGFRFNPTDQQLMNRLKNKLIGFESDDCEIVQVDLSKWNPQELSRSLSSGTSVYDDDCWFFYYMPVYTKNGVIRKAEGGFWKSTGKVRPIMDRRTGEKIGERRILVFHLGTSGKVEPSQRTGWVIHEYYCTTTLTDQSEKVVKDFFLCKLKLKVDRKTEFPTREHSESSYHLPSVINGLDGQTCLHLPSNSSLAKPLVEESQHNCHSDSRKNMMENGDDDTSCYSPFNSQEPVVEKPEVVPDKVSAKGVCGSIRNSPHHSGDSSLEDIIQEDGMDELLALLDFSNDCNVGDGCIPSLPLVPQEQMPTSKNIGQSSNSEKDDDLGSFLTDCNEGSLIDRSNQLKMISDDQGNLSHLTGLPQVVSSRKRSHDEDDELSCVTNLETAQAKRARVICFSKNGVDEKACCQAFPEDGQGSLHMTSGLQNKTSEYNKAKADCALAIDHEELEPSSASLSVLHKQGVPTKVLENEHDRMLEEGLFSDDLDQSAPSSMYRDMLGSEIRNVGLDNWNTVLDLYSCQGTPYTVDDPYILSSSYNSNTNTGTCDPLVMTYSPMSAPVGENLSNCM